jgi:diacylglycerol kinase family enzyme
VSDIHRDRVAVVINGNAKDVTSELVDVLDQIIASGDLFVSRSLEEGREIATEIAARGYQTVLTGGGDGTFSQMVTAVVRACDDLGHPRPRFGLLRLGTGNALAWVLGAQKHHRGVVADLARLRREGGHRDLRLLEVEGTLAPFAGVGVDALALRHFNEVRDAIAKVPVLRRFGRGRFSYFIAIAGRTLPEVLVRSHTHMRVINEGEDAYRLGPSGQPEGEPIRRGEVLFEGLARAVTFASIPYWGFGSRIFPFAEDREDRFNLRVVNLESVDVALHIHQIWNGTYRTPRLVDFLVDAVRIESAEVLPLQIGGDAAGTTRSVRARLYPDPIAVVDFYAPPPV